MIKDIIKKTIIPFFNLLNAVYLKSYYKNMYISQSFCHLNDICGKKILVVSPHQDDETIGMGGTIVKLKKNNHIDIIYTTDGRLKSYKNFPKNISQVRQEESRRIFKNFNIDVKFFKYVNNTLSSNLKNLETNLFKNICEFNYDIIFSTSLTECTMDHFYTTLALLSALKKLNSSQLELYFYEINNSLQGKFINAISVLDKNELEKKKSMLDVYRSQKYIDFKLIKIMDKQKSNINNCKFIGEAVEIFHKVNLDELKLDYMDEVRDIFKDMKTTTSSLRLIHNMNINKKFIGSIENLYIYANKK